MARNKTDITSEGNKKSDKSERIKREIIDYVKALLAAIVLAALIMTFIAQSFYVDGMSMEPNYHHGERVMVNKVTYYFSDPKRGDVIVLKVPTDPSKRYIKRVIGLPGDTVELKGGGVYINGVMLDEPYIYAKSFNNYGPVIVSEGCVFVMGDNRNNSEDSRSVSVGMVPYNLVVGKALFVYWPISSIRGCEHYRDYPEGL